MARRLRGSAPLVAALLLVALAAGSRCVSGQNNSPIEEVLGALASGWANDNLASITCETAPDILLCNDQGEVVSMQLDGLSTNRAATIPADLANITTLTYLSMVGNSLTSSIPESFSSLSLLESLDFDSNNVDKVEGVSALTNLRYLNLQHNRIGPAPLTIISPLISLEYLNLFNNSFEGSLKALSKLPKLETLQVAFNHIGPDIPSTLSRLSVLTLLDLAYNRLRGPIDSLTALRALQDLSLYGNAVSGSFPDSISRLSRLTSLQIGVTNFTGTLPASLGKMSTLEQLYLDYTTMVGSLPASLGNLTNLAAICPTPPTAST
ncbi:unnamed protein product [Closterium sp. Naga37s-1]|nr:unnamed protein product [Closterium sp. Naga37s-1]